MTKTKETRSLQSSRQSFYCLSLLAFGLTCFVYVFFVFNEYTSSSMINTRIASLHSWNGLFNFSGYRSNTTRASIENDNEIINPAVHVFNATYDGDKTLYEQALKHNCVPLRTPSKVPTKICIYKSTVDVFVSGSLIRGGMWEHDLVALTHALLSRNPGMMMLDLGCNIGVFTIYHARLGRKVVSVDANIFNLMLLSRSLEMNHLHQNVTLVWNAVSDKYDNVTLKRNPNNVGGYRIQDSNTQRSKQVAPGNVIDSIMLDDIAPLFGKEKVFIKMDIEETEHRALKGGANFFKLVNVRYVLMEFMWHRKGQSGKQICDMLTERGFIPYPPNLAFLRPLSSSQYTKWPDNVLWSKT